jgi:hypothetical protein
MKLFINIASVLALSLPLMACNGMGPFGGEPNSPPGYYRGYQSHNQYPNRPVSSASSESYQAEAKQKNKNQSGVTMVEHGSATATKPKAVTTGKSVVTHEGPMVPGEAPKVQ